jgi:lipoprotein-anchoring transpeptidase ErfK/SrfK
MTKLRHLVWMMIAAGTLVLSTSQGFAQSRPDVDEPGLIADDSYQLDPEWQKQVVYYRTNEAPGTIIISTAERHLYLVQGNGQCAALRHRRRPRRLPPGQGTGQTITKQGRMAGLDPAAGDDRAPALSAALHGGRAGQSARRTRDVSRHHGLPHPRHQRSPTPSAPTISSGCFRLVNADVTDLYNRVPVGTKVIIRQKPEL